METHSIWRVWCTVDVFWMQSVLFSMQGQIECHDFHSMVLYWTLEWSADTGQNNLMAVQHIIKAKASSGRKYCGLRHKTRRHIGTPYYRDLACNRSEPRRKLHLHRPQEFFLSAGRHRFCQLGKEELYHTFRNFKRTAVYHTKSYQPVLRGNFPQQYANLLLTYNQID